MGTNLSVIGGAPKGYAAGDYARDTAIFRTFLKQTSPNTIFLGPGSVAESQGTTMPANLGVLSSEELLRATGPVYDAYSYHLYPAVSERCAGMSPKQQTSAAAALSSEQLRRTDEINAFYTSLRDRFLPGKPIWVTETADAACGGNEWAATFLDTFRYLDEHGRLAQQGVRVVAHNTLAASDYGLVEESTFAPRPNYWAALLWHTLMGTTVLKPPVGEVPVYAHCSAETPGGVSILAINTDRARQKRINVSLASSRYTLTAAELEGKRVDLNGAELKLVAGDALPKLAGVQTPPGPVALPPASISFLSIRDAHNSACQ